MLPSISIIVLTCNQVDYTLALLESLAPWLRENPDSELIIVDNGSKDNTRAMVMTSGYAEPPQLRYYYNEKNLGVAGGRNIGLKKAKKEYILFLDNDTEVTPEAIDSLRRYLSENPECGLVAPALKSKEGEIQYSAKPFPGLGIKLRHILNKGKISASEKKAMESGHPYYVIGACQLFRRGIVDQIGYLDENIFYGPEDADWCERIRKTGKSIDYLPHVLICHHWQRATTNSPLSSPLSKAHIKALLYFYKKHKRLF